MVLPAEEGAVIHAEASNARFNQVDLDANALCCTVKKYGKLGTRVAIMRKLQTSAATPTRCPLVAIL